MTLSIIIPCRNEEKYIGQCIQSFIKMDYDKNLIEILVVDGNSGDGTVSVVKKFQSKFPFIRLINNPNKFTPFGLNLGIKNAKNDFIMIASAHSDFSKDYLNEVFSAIQDFDADAAGGIMITEAKNKTKKTLSICKVLSNKLGVGNSVFRTGTGKTVQVDTVPFGVYRKELFNEVGLYDERLIRNHDIEFSKRILSAGKKIYLVPSAKSIYYVRETFKEISKNNFSNGLWNILTVYITRKLNSISLRHFVPLVFLLSIILPLILGFWFKTVMLVAAFSFTVYLLTIIYTGLKINNRRESSFYYIIWSFIVLHFSYGIGSLIGLFRFDYLLKNK